MKKTENANIPVIYIDKNIELEPLSQDPTCTHFDLLLALIEAETYRIAMEQMAFAFSYYPNDLRRKMS